MCIRDRWYNALRFVADMVREGGNEILADTLDAQAEITGKSFVDIFRNEYGYLFDYVDGYMTVSYTHLLSPVRDWLSASWGI